LGCKDKEEKKCDDCKARPATIFLTDTNDPSNKDKLCKECKQKRKDNDATPEEDNQLPPPGSCVKCKKRCDMFAENYQNLGKNNIHCPKCGKDLTGKKYTIMSIINFGKFSTEVSGSRVSCGSDCPAVKAEQEAQAKKIKAIQEKYKSATDFIWQLRDKLLKPSEGATAYNTGYDKAFYSGGK